MLFKKILIAPNSFKECADSVNISDLIYSKLSEQSDLILIKRPISDGGDGFLSVCALDFNLEILKYLISTPYNEEKFLCEVGYDRINKTVYIETANVMGMKIIPLDKRHPVKLSSKGMGDLLLSIMKDMEAGKIEANEIVIGIGGTGTNDLGIGMLSRMGLNLLGSEDKIIEPLPIYFNDIKSINDNVLKVPFRIKLIVDVDNPLLGETGATKVFGRQKGSTDEEVEFIESGFSKIINLFDYKGLLRSSKILSGAGGGIAAAFQVFFDAEIMHSNVFISENLNIRDIADIDLIITGEGKFDEQSIMKKATGSILEISEPLSTPVLLICGKIDDNIKTMLPERVTVFELVQVFGNENESIKNFNAGLKMACDVALKIIES